MNNYIALLERHPDLISKTDFIVSGESLYDTSCPDLLLKSKVKFTTWNFEHYLQLKNSFDSDRVQFEVIGDSTLLNQEIILIWPKSKVLAKSLVLNLKAQKAKVHILAANDLGGKSLAKTLADIANVSKIDLAKRCTLWEVHWSEDSETQVDRFNWLKHVSAFSYADQKFLCLPGVFNYGKLDTGTELLLTQLPDIKGKVLDVGCGSGVIGLTLATRNPEIELTMTDIDAMALRSAELNAMRSDSKIDILASNGLDHVDGRFDLIISNPPFHTGKETDYRFSQNLFQKGKQHLTHKGRIWLVANRQLPYEGWAKEHFSNVNVITQKKGFKVLELFN